MIGLSCTKVVPLPWYYVKDRKIFPPRIIYLVVTLLFSIFCFPSTLRVTAFTMLRLGAKLGDICGLSPLLRVKQKACVACPFNCLCENEGKWKWRTSQDDVACPFPSLFGAKATSVVWKREFHVVRPSLVERSHVTTPTKRSVIGLH